MYVLCSLRSFDLLAVGPEVLLLIGIQCWKSSEHLVDQRLVDQAEAQRAVSTKVEAQKAVHQVGKAGR